MADLRDMELVAALARNRHFARAAAECGISQPAFSARIRNLELSLGAPIVKRGNRFIGFTREGEIVLKWAHQMLADAQGLRQEIDEARDVLSGSLTIGAVPTTLTFVAHVAADLRKRHDRLTIQIFSSTSVEISKGLEDFSLDAGITYLETALPATSATEHLYDERYEVLVPRAFKPEQTEQISWADAAALPLCLLTKNMLNRKIVDTAFQAAAAEPNVVMETNAFTAALAQVSSAAAATIAPEVLARTVAKDADVVRLRLVDPVVEKPIGVVTADRKPMLPSVRAFLDSLRAALR